MNGSFSSLSMEAYSVANSLRSLHLTMMFMSFVVTLPVNHEHRSSVFSWERSPETSNCFKFEAELAVRSFIYSFIYIFLALGMNMQQSSEWICTHFFFFFTCGINICCAAWKSLLWSRSEMITWPTCRWKPRCTAALAPLRSSSLFWLASHSERSGSAFLPWKNTHRMWSRG